MEFDKAKVFTALNADELRKGDKVIVADDLASLKRCVKENDRGDTLYKVEDESGQYRFGVISGGCEVAFNLAYLVEKVENCTNCKKNHNNYNGCERLEAVAPLNVDNKILCCSDYISDKENCTDQEELKLIKTTVCDDRFEVIARAREHIIKATNIEQSPDEMKVLDDFLFRCWQIGGLNEYECSEPKPEQKAEPPKYRPFRDTDELIAHWLEIGGKWQKRELTMPFIWVRNKSDDRKVWLITEFDKRILDYLFTNCEFLNGAPCGVEVVE